MSKKNLRDEFTYKFHDEPPIVSSETLLGGKSLDKKSNKQLSNSDLSEISGGFLIGNKDEYTIQEYNCAGVTREVNIFKKDNYYYQGRKISQKEAEKITTAYFYNKDKKRPEKKTITIEV